MGYSTSMKKKVFCIGFHKTGTTSLSEALMQLQYTVTGPNGLDDPNIANNALAMALELTAQFDAFQDNPWPILYKELDDHFPNSQFILTLREPNSWIKSQVSHFGSSETPMRQWIYGVGAPQGNEAVYLKRYEQHNEAVLNHFKNRPQDLLVLNLADGDGWEKLCPFLGVAIPKSAFPHSNKASDREKKGLSRFLHKLKLRLTV